MVEEPVREHPVGVARLAAGLGPRAVQRRLHRRRRDPVRVDDEGLDEQHDRDRADDRDDPVDRHPPRVGQAAGQPVDRVARVPRRAAAVAARPAPAADRGTGTAARSGVPASRDRRRKRRAPGAVSSSRWGSGRLGERALPQRRCAVGGRTDRRLDGLRSGRLLGRANALVVRRGRRLPAVVRPIVDVAHAVLRARLCSARQLSIRAWFPERSTSGTSQPENSAGRV